MVAAAEKPVKVSKSGKVRTNVNGRIAWVYPEEMPSASPQAAAAADLASPLLGWDGDEPDDDFLPYEDYLESKPTRAQMRPYVPTVFYWEPTEPGISLQPYPSLGPFQSNPTGFWPVNNLAQEEAVRERLARTTGLDPDVLKLTEADWDTINGRGNAQMASALRWCHDPGCHWVSCSALANNLHEQKRGHTTHAKPRER
jgi:hypothetical protein